MLISSQSREAVMKVIGFICAVASSLTIGSSAWAQEIPREYQQVLKTLGKPGDRQGYAWLDGSAHRGVR